MSNFNSGPSAAGYIYQARLALRLTLSYAYMDSDIVVAVERWRDGIKLIPMNWLLRA